RARAVHAGRDRAARRRNRLHHRGGRRHEPRVRQVAQQQANEQRREEAGELRPAERRDALAQRPGMTDRYRTHLNRPLSGSPGADEGWAFRPAPAACRATVLPYDRVVTAPNISYRAKYYVTTKGPLASGPPGHSLRAPRLDLSVAGRR